MDILFQPAEEATASVVRRRHADMRGNGSADKRRTSGERELGELGMVIREMGPVSEREEVRNMR